MSTAVELRRGAGLWTPQRLLPDGSLPPTLGPKVVAWIQRNLVHAEGDFLGEPFVLEPWQQQLIFRLYEYDPVTLERFTRRLFLVLPKGTGKTSLVAAIALAELAGPTVPLDAEGRGGLRKSPNIPVAAASFEQADRLYSAARGMVEKGPLAPLMECYETEMVLRGRPGRLYRVAAIAGSNDGTLPTCFVADEIHEWVDRRERVHLVIGNSLAKRSQTLELNLSTPDAADPDSLFGRLHAHAMKVIDGELEDPSLLAVWFTAQDHWKLEDPQELRSAIAEATPASWLNIERIAARLEIDRIPEHEFRRYHLAQLRRPTGSWLPPRAWEELATSGLKDPAEGASVTLFFDGSYNGDSSALVGCTVGGLDLPAPQVRQIFVVGLWEKPEGWEGEEWMVPRDEVDAAVKAAFSRWKVRRMGCDPFGWHEEIGRWAEAYGEEIVVIWETTLRKRMAEACSRFYTAVVRERSLRHGGDARLARHLRNARVKETPEGAYIVKDGRMSPRKIDAAVAAVGALQMAADVDPDYDVLQSVH